MIKLNFHSFYIVFDYPLFIKVQLNQYTCFNLLNHLFINYWFLEFLKSYSRYFLKPSSADCWLVCIIFIGLEFIDPETCPQVWLQIISGQYPNRTYWFYSPTGLWKVLVRLPFFVIAPVEINTLIGFKAVPQVWYFWWVFSDFF